MYVRFLVRALYEIQISYRKLKDPARSASQHLISKFSTGHGGPLMGRLGIVWGIVSTRNFQYRQLKL